MRPGSLRVVVEVVVGVVLLCGEVATKDWFDECTFSPNVASATSMECQFMSDETHIRRNLLYSVESIRITSGKFVYVDKEALVNFIHLRNIHITGVQILSFRQNSLLQIKEQKPISLTVEQVDVVTLDTGALSDWQNPGSKISLKKIGTLTVSKQALPSNSIFQNVMIENVPSLQMETESVQAKIEYLRLINVTLMVCLSNTFNGHIRHMSLVSVSCDRLQLGCIRGKPGWKSLIVHSSRLGHVATSGIQGAIEDIHIEDSELGNVEKGGFDLEVLRFSLSSCSIGELGETALQVRANRSISLHTLRVNTLQRNALRGLRILSPGDYRRPGEQQPQICLSSLTADTAAEDALQLDEDSPVSLYGRVCPSEAEQTGNHTQCIGADSEALVSLKVFRSRCCFDGIGSKSPACRTYGWVPYVALVAGMVLLAAVALLCYRRRLLAKKRQVVRRGGQPRVSMVPSVDGLGSDASDHGSPECAFRGVNHGKQCDPETTGSVFKEAEEHGAQPDTGPLASWLQTLRETMPRHLERGCVETIEMVENQAPEEPGAPVLQGTVCVDYDNLPLCADAGSETESVLREGTELVEEKKSEAGKQKASPDAQRPEDCEETEASVPDTRKAANRLMDKDQDTQTRSKKTKSAPRRPSGHSTAEPGQLFEPEQPAPMYAEVNKKQKRAATCGQPAHQVASSTEASGNEKAPSRPTSANDGDATEAGGAVSTAFSGESSTGGQRQPDVFYADVFNSLSREPTAEPATHHRRGSTADSVLYDDVYHALSTVRTHNPGPDVASKCSAEYDETYDDLPIVTKNSDAGSRISLMRCPLYGEEREGPHTGNSRWGHDAGAVLHTRRSAELPLYAEVNDEGLVTSNGCTVPREGYMYIEASEGDRSGVGPGRTACMSHLYAEASDFPPTGQQEAVSRKANVPEAPSYATVFKKTRDPKGKENSKARGWFSFKPFSRTGS